MEMKWSRWFRCESSFGLLLVPNQPGIFALAEEIMEPAGPLSRRMLAVFEIDEAEDLVRALNRLFTPASPWRNRLASARCYMRYALVPDPEERTAAAMSLRNWLDAQREAAAQVFEMAVPGRRADETDNKTVAERAVDHVTRARGPAKAASAG
jgi:hypothetical protein